MGNTQTILSMTALYPTPASVKSFEASPVFCVSNKRTQRAQHPLIKKNGLNYIGLHIMI